MIDFFHRIGFNTFSHHVHRMTAVDQIMKFKGYSISIKMLTAPHAITAASAHLMHQPCYLHDDDGDDLLIGRHEITFTTKQQSIQSIGNRTTTTMTTESNETSPAALAAEDPSVPTDAPKEIHIHGLVVLPPLQRSSANNNNGVSADDMAAAIALPPLRADEAVAALRGALSEIVHFGQLTKFRFRVEAIHKVNGKASSSKGDTASTAINSYTLSKCVVSVPPSIKTLECRRDVSKADDEADEMVLDDYGDLSLLAEMLQESPADNKTGDEAAESEGKIILQAKDKLAIRVVLERYDLNAVREQIGRVRALLAGNAPALRTLNLDDLGEADSKQGAIVDGSPEATAEEQNSGELKSDTGKNDRDSKVSDKVTPKQTAAEIAAEAKQLAAEHREAMAKQLPQYPTNYDLTFSNVNKGDLTNFYHYACGEELALLDNNNGHKSKTNALDEWISDGDENTSKKKKKNQKKKSKNNNINGHAKNGNNASPTNNKATAPVFSVTETERVLHTLNSQTIIDCTIRLSGYHSPPSHRRILGDLAYIEFIMLGEPIVNITAFSLGFYVNNSTTSVFDPTPASEACYSHSLLDCILQKSKTLRDAWSTALQASEKRAEVLKLAALSEDAFAQLYRPATSNWWNNYSGTSLGLGLSLSAPNTYTSRLDGITLRPAWLVNLPNIGNKQCTTWKSGNNLHKWNVGRCEEELTNMYGMDVRNGGLRDWNEELQAARDMPVETLEERMDRARMINKILSDFSEAALHGIQAISSGYIMPMNPNEPARSHVYLHNNIFFSRAVDAGLDTFKVIQGDRAAKKSAGKEAHNVGVIHRLDVPGLYTLGTVLVEYLGTRFVCQSVVPGILHGEKAHTLTYGSVEALSELQCEAETHKVLEDSLGEECMVATRGVLSKPLTEERIEEIKQFKSTLPLALQMIKKEPETDDGIDKVNHVCGPVEMKGIVGSDKRTYVLDCTRLTPRDANWVSKSKGGTGYWEEGLSSDDSKVTNLIPSSLDDDEWTASVLRPELVTSYADEKLKEFLLARQAKEADASKAEEKQDPKDNDEAAGEATSESQDKDWVDVKKSPEKKTDADAEKKRQEEEDFIKTLRYNVNVFLPYLKSIESIDQEAYEQIKKDEEEARKIASFLWNEVLPDVTKKLRLDNGKTFQIPVDGKSLTEFLHKRGINCRYLGRLADLAKIEEQNDIDAEKAHEKNKKENKPPRFRMPLCWLELLECEMVARAAKHVLDSYLTENGGTAAIQPAQTIASLLNAVVSIGEETANETELRKAVSGDDVISADVIKSLTLFDVGGNGDAVHRPVRGRAEIWSDIEKEVGRRFRYKLSLYNNCKVNNRTMYTALLRRICQRSGIRLVAKAYELGGKCVCGVGTNSAGSLNYSYPIAAVDIVDVLPLVKHAASSGEEAFAPCRFDSNNTSTLHIVLADAKAIYDAALRHLNSGNISLAADFAQEAVSLYQRVIDSPLHVQIAKSLHLLSKCHLYGSDHEAAISSCLKYLTVSVSLGGFDCMESVSAHNQLSDAYFVAGKVKEGIKHVRAMQFLMEFMAGGNYSQLSPVYYKIGTQYFEGEKLLEALSFYDVARKKRADDRMVDGIIASSAAMAFAHLGKFSEASSEEKVAYQLYQALLGEDHDRTKISSTSLLQFMRVALEQRKIVAAQKNKLSREYEADAIAESIKAEEDKAESAAKKKKKKKKSKGGNSSENENTPENTTQNASKAA